MANLNPGGIHTQTGQDRPLGPSDALLAGNVLVGSTGAQGRTGIFGSTGLSNTVQGETGISLQGLTGLQGVTGLRGVTGLAGSQGFTGLQGLTGISQIGFTGLQGATGIPGVTGIIGDQGITGFQGIAGGIGGTGLIGATGIQGTTGLSLSGVTGLQGATGLLGDTGLQGATGVGILGNTGLSGVTGLIGATGFLDLLSLNVFQQGSGATGIYYVPPNTLNTDLQQLEYIVSARSATDGATTILIVEFGGFNLLTDVLTVGGGATAAIRGYIIRTSTFQQEASVNAVYSDSTGNTAWSSPTADLTATQLLAASVSSSGAGHVIFALVTRRIEDPS
jgi:hypothetical protein